ncbi:MAG: hypothetical protein JKY88_08005 [Pseudomonadales bacterium]|nr:hypothetical protein [Pseudomonadales bacterium]
MTETVGGASYCRLDDDLGVLSETIGTPDPRQPIRLWHEEGRVFIMLHQGRELSDDELKTQLKESLGNYKIPKYFTFLDALPMLSIGKIDKNKLQTLAKNE